MAHGHDENGNDGESCDAPDVHVLYMREASRLLRFFGRRSRPEEDVADLVQETFLRFLRTAPAGTVERPTAYLHRIARNLLFDRARRGARHNGALAPVPIDSVEIAVPPDQNCSIETSQLMEQYERALEALPPRTREVFLLHRVDELSYKAIALRLGIGVRTVEWHIAEALVRIRRMLDEA